MIAGLAIGMSIQGLKPVAEFQFMGFIYPAMNQIISHAARMRNRTRGRLHCPLVFRAPFGEESEHQNITLKAPKHYLPIFQVYKLLYPLHLDVLMVCSWRQCVILIQ